MKYYKDFFSSLFYALVVKFKKVKVEQLDKF